MKLLHENLNLLEGVCEQIRDPVLLCSGVYAVLSGLSPFLLPSLGEDEPPLAGPGLRRDLSGNSGMLRPGGVLRLLLRWCRRH